MPGGDGEFAAIERIRLAFDDPPPGETWIGDDAAVVRVPGSGWMLLAADMVVEGVHFELGLVEPADVGWKALAVNVSDIAAMGGRPLQALVTVSGADGPAIDGIIRGLSEASAAYGCAVVGGDISAGRELVVSVSVTGEPSCGRPVLRSGARPGDVLFVTGPLGASAAGLRALRATSEGAGPAPAGLAAAYRRPVARLAEGQAAAAAGAGAMIDISDGLGVDLDRLACASGVGVVVQSVPVVPGATEEEALGGGEDYELVFAAPDPAAVLDAFAAAGLRPPIRLGGCVADGAARRLGEGELLASGWEHRLR